MLFFPIRHKYSDLLSRVSAIADGNSHADMIQDLNDLVVLGKLHLPELAAIKFNTDQLDEAAALADKMADLLGKASSEDDTSETKKLRDKAFTLCKESVDGIRKCGQYVFWRDEERVKGYGCAYNRRYRGKKRREPAPELTPDH